MRTRGLLWALVLPLPEADHRRPLPIRTMSEQRLVLSWYGWRLRVQIQPREKYVATIYVYGACQTLVGRVEHTYPSSSGQSTSK